MDYKFDFENEDKDGSNELPLTQMHSYQNLQRILMMIYLKDKQKRKKLRLLNIKKQKQMMKMQY